MAFDPVKIAFSGFCALSLSACMVAGGYTEKEQDIVDNMAPAQYQPATREMRQNIKTQDTLAQAAFWSREYQLNPADLEAAVNLAAAVRKMGNPGKAVEITQTTRALYPTDPYLTAEFAAALIASERGSEAIQPLDTALGTTPGYARLWSLKGAALDQMEKYDFARQHYMRALKITPNDPNVMANLGLSYALSGDPRTAEQWLRRAASQPNANAGIQQNLDLVLQLQGKQAQAAPRPQLRQQQGYPTQPRAQQPVASKMSTPPLRSRAPVLTQSTQAPANQFGYSTQVYSGSNAPKSASEAAMAASKAMQQRQTMTAPLQTQPAPQTQQLAGAMPQYPQASYPQTVPTQMQAQPQYQPSSTPPRRPPARRR